MKWLGQYIQDLPSRFRHDVYLEDVSTGTIASGAHLGLDSNNKIVKAADGGGDLTAIVAGTGLSGSSLTGPIPTLNVDASQTQITRVGTIDVGTWRGDAILTAYIGDDQITEDKLADTLLAEIDANTAKDSNVVTNLGISGSTDARTITSSDGTNAVIPVATTSVSGVMSTEIFDAVTENTAKATNVATNLTATTHAVRITINSSDGTNVAIEEASGSIAGVMTTVHHDKLDGIESSATADQSKSDIDGLGITTVGTIDTGVWTGTAIATDQQKHLATFDIRGYGTADGTNYEIPVGITDNQAPFEHNESAGADGLTALPVTKLIRAAGVVMPYAGTLKKWKGWSTHSTTSGTCNIALFKYTPVAGNSSAVSLVLLDAVAHTPAGNSKVIDIEQTSFTDADVAEGDIIISGIKGDGSQITYFVSTLEIEWD